MISFDSVRTLIKNGKYDFAFEEFQYLATGNSDSTTELLEQDLLKADLFLKKREYYHAQETALAIINNPTISLDHDAHIYLDAILILGEVYLSLHLADDGLKIIQQGKSLLNQYQNFLSGQKNFYQTSLFALEGILYGFQGDYK